MMNRLSLSLFVFLIFILAGCGGDQPPESPVAQVADTAVPPICRVLQELNFRAGPGLSYDPPLRALPDDTLLTPIAFSLIGFPGGQWVQARDNASGEIGWVSAGSQFVDCNLDLTTLPSANEIPPTPTLPPPPTLPPVPTANIPPPPTDVPPPTIAVDGPPRVTNNAPGGTTADYVEAEVFVNDDFLFRIAVADTRFGHEDGVGIHYVEFTITTLSGDTVYFNREDFAAYCTFQGGVPDCNPWPERNGRYYWGVEGPEMQPGEYHARILVYPQDPAFDGEVWNWDFDFTLDTQ